MKTNWLIKKLGEILSPIPSSIKLAKKNMLKTGEFRVIDQSQSFISGYSNNKSDLYQGDLPVIVFGDHTLTLKFIDFPFVRGADGTQILRPKKGVDTKFLFYQLLSNPLANHGYSRHFQYLKDKKITIPPLKIQQKIVERLDAIRKAQDLNDLQISRTQELFESLIKENIIDNRSSEQVPIENVCLKQEFYNPAKQPDIEFTYVDISAIDSLNYSVNINQVKKIKGRNAPSRARKKISVGDVIFSTVRPNLMRIAEVSKNFDGAIASTGFTVLKPDEKKIVPRYLSLMTCYGIVTTQVLSRIRGANYPAVTDKDVFNAKIPLPKTAEQQKIVEKLNAVQDYRKSLLRQKSLLRELFDSVLQKSLKFLSTEEMGMKDELN